MAGPDAAGAAPRGGLLLPAALAAAWLAAVGVFELLRPAGSAHSLCILRTVSGIPCPTCGTTRAVRALAAGRPLDALGYNPLVMTAMTAVAAWLLLRALGAAPRRRATARPWHAPALALATVLLVLANWLYVLVHDGTGGLAWR